MTSEGPLGDKMWYRQEAAATWEMEVEAGFRRAGFTVIAEAPVGEDYVNVRIGAEEWALLRKTLLRGASVLADERRAEDYLHEYYGGWGEVSP